MQDVSGAVFLPDCSFEPASNLGANATKKGMFRLVANVRNAFIANHPVVIKTDHNDDIVAAYPSENVYQMCTHSLLLKVPEIQAHSRILPL